MIYTKKDYQ